ncbi:MAG TPA: MerR family transcriptional regulator [Candidatus Xenobia bacterium]
MDNGFSIEELTEQVGIPVRTLRYYIAEGLLPGPGSRGKGARYGREHLSRLRAIRRLVEQHVPLAEIRERLAGLGQNEVERLAAGADQPTARAWLESLLHAGVPPPPPPPASPAAETWRRRQLRPGVELMVRSDVEGRYAARIRQIERLFE